MRKFEVTTHEDDQQIEAHYMKVLKDNQERPTYIVFTKVNDSGEGTSTVAIFNFASVVSIVDITDRPVDNECTGQNTVVRDFNGRVSSYL